MYIFVKIMWLQKVIRPLTIQSDYAAENLQEEQEWLLKLWPMCAKTAETYSRKHQSSPK